MFILDTHVVSELRKVRLGKADANLARWADSVAAADLYLRLIAATALVHGMTVVTRNTGDFTPTGARVFNPWT